MKSFVTQTTKFLPRSLRARGVNRLHISATTLR